MKKLLFSIISLIGVANAGTITVANSDLNFAGAVTTGYFASTNTGSNNYDLFKVSNFLLNLSSDAKEGSIGFNAALGTILLPTILDGGLTDNKAILNKDFGIIYGYASYIPIKDLEIDAGLLTTNIGYELPISWSNPNITYGAVFYAEPFIYPGFRITYTIKDIKLYGEISKDKGYLNGDTTLPTSGAFAIGTLGKIADIDYALSYYDYTAYKNLINFVLSKTINDNLDVGINFDYQWLDNTYKDKNNISDKNAYGTALYIKPKFSNLSLPIRIEYIQDNTKGNIYSAPYKTGYTITLTPTYNISKNSYIRGEISYIKSDEKVFSDSNENKKYTKTSAALELGFLF